MNADLEDRMRAAIALAFEGEGPAWWGDDTGDHLARVAARAAARLIGSPEPLPFPDGPAVLLFEVGEGQDWRAVQFESPAAAEAWRTEHAERLRTAVQPYVPGHGRFYAGVGVSEGMVPLVSPDVVLTDAQRARAEIWNTGSGVPGRTCLPASAAELSSTRALAERAFDDHVLAVLEAEGE